MKLVQRADELSAIVSVWRTQGKIIGLVPTMGWFHQGHLSLMEMALQKADKVIVSLFVNPMQFGQGEDLASYPRDLSRDFKLAEKIGIDVLFAPAVEDIYPADFQTTVSVAKLSQGLCGASRPGHFEGVTTIVAKLFNIAQPHLVIFGEKDYQQLTVIRQMVKDLHFNLEIIGHPIVRESDGLAMSSRNKYLNEEERNNALSLNKAIQFAKKRATEVGSQLSISQLISQVKQIINTSPGCVVDYVEIINKDTLVPCSYVDRNSLIAVAAKINNRVRLIDNAILISDN
jgi:pantoate--beta-alanine ligase